MPGLLPARRLLLGIMALVVLPRGSLGDCPFPPVFDDAVIKDEFNELRYFRVGLVVQYFCHHKDSKVPSFNITCTKKSQWSKPKIPCKAIMCKAPVVENGIKLSGFGPRYTYGKTITFECNIGYFMVGSYLIRCEINSTWYPEIPSCKKIDPGTCGAPLILSGTVHPFKPQYTSGKIITVTCNLHYSFPDDTIEMTTVCQGYNVWDPPVLPCLLRTSPDIFQLTINHGAVIHGKKKNYEPGDIVVITCDAGYTLVGPSEIRYIGGNQWIPHIPSCSLNFFLVLLITACLLILLWLPAISIYQKYCK